LVQVRLVQRRLVLEQLVVHLPELALRVRGHGGLGGRLGVVVERERVVLPHEADLVPVLLLHLRQRRFHTAAERALEVGEDDDLERRRLRALRGRVTRLDVVHLRVRLGAFVLTAGRARRSRRNLALGLLEQRLVHVRLGRALGDHALGRRHFLVYLRLERLERLRAREELAVDEERRRATRADLPTRGRVGLDAFLALLRVEGRLELAHVEAQLTGVLLVGLAVHVLLIREDLVVHLPELPLLAGGSRRDGGRHRVRVEGQRQIA